MRYNKTGDRLLDAAFAERLMLKGCEPLPRRRCPVRGPAGFPDPTPFPCQSGWRRGHPGRRVWGVVATQAGTAGAAVTQGGVAGAAATQSGADSLASAKDGEMQWRG